MLAVALWAETDAFVEHAADAILPEGHQRVVRRGPERGIQTGTGPPVGKRALPPLSRGGRCSPDQLSRWIA